MNYQNEQKTEVKFIIAYVTREEAEQIYHKEYHYDDSELSN